MFNGDASHARPAPILFPRQVGTITQYQAGQEAIMGIFLKRNPPNTCARKCV